MLKRLVMVYVFWIPAACFADPVLLMAEQAGCYWCARWDTEIAPIYPKTAEGRAAPLMRFDIKNPPPGMDLEDKVHFTPTFILIVNGKEVERIEGYPGEDFFWGILGGMLNRANISFDQPIQNNG